MLQVLDARYTQLQTQTNFTFRQRSQPIAPSIELTVCAIRRFRFCEHSRRDFSIPNRFQIHLDARNIYENLELNGIYVNLV